MEVSGVAIEGLHDQMTVEAVAQERSKVIHKVANVGAAFERNTRHVFAKQLRSGASHEVFV
jgi:aspartate oxidase